MIRAPRAVRAALAIGLAGAFAFALGLLLDPVQALHGWLIAWAFVHGTVVGMLVFLMIIHAMGATWPTAVRRLVEATVAAMPVVALLSLPILAGVPWLYPWRHPERIADPAIRAVAEHRGAYLNWGGFIARALVYQGVWLVTARLLRRWSFQMDYPNPPDRARAMKIASSVLLPPVGIAFTFASYDWLMSLSADWYSTMFGLYYSVGGLLAAVALLVLLTVFAERTGRLPGITTSHYYALGRLLLALLCTWAYIAFFQFFLTWIANRPVEARWYLERARGGYRVLSGFLFFGHFVVPFVLLLSYAIKRHATSLAGLAAWILACHYLDVHWLVSPARAGGGVFHWTDFAALAAVVGLTLCYALFAQRGHPLAPVGDPRLAPALAYRSR